MAKPGAPDVQSMTKSARDVMLRGRYGEPTDTYTWELVVDRCLHVLSTAGFVIVKAPDAD